MATATTELVELAQKITASPTLYLTDALGSRPYQRQIEIAEAVGSSRRVSVVGCNGSGKDWLAARMALWWVTAHYPAKVIITGPTYRQVDDVCFNELRAAYRSAPAILGGRLFESPRWELDETTFIVGFSTDRPWNLQGFHSPHLMVIVTEAHAMSEESINALYRLNPDTMLMVGNPFAMTGPFYASHHQSRENWTTFSISAFDTPNLQEGRVVVPGMVTAEDVADRAAEWGEDSPMYQGAVFGEFPDSLDDTLVPLAWATAAVNRETELEALVDQPVKLGVDVARFGKDLTIVYRRQGPLARKVWSVQGRDTMAIVGWLAHYIEQENANNGTPPVDSVVVDDTGVGGGVTDRLREVITSPTRVEAFNGGSSAEDKEHFANAISEAWWRMRLWFQEDEADVGDDPSLIGQVTTRGFSYRSDKTILIQSKKELSRSPDEADALAMTFGATGPVARLRGFL